MKRQVPKYIYKFNVSTKDYISVYKITIKYQKKKKKLSKRRIIFNSPKGKNEFRNAKVYQMMNADESARK